MTFGAPDGTVLGLGVALFTAGLILIAATTGQAGGFQISIDPERKGNALVGGVLAMLLGVVLGVAAFVSFPEPTPPPPEPSRGPGPEPPPTTPPPVDEPTAPVPLPSSSAAPVAGCAVTTGNPLATIHAEPDSFSTEVSRVPPGTYEVQEAATVDFGPERQRWFLITVAGRNGWLEDTTFNIASRASECP